MKIIGISGTNGSGKDTVSRMLVERYAFLHADATAILVAELNKRRLPLDRTHKSALSAEWRREFGMAVIVDKAIDMFKAASNQYKGLVVGSLRHPGEADRVHEQKGLVIWVDAEPKIRYDRIQKNLHERVGTHAEQGKSFEEFIADEQREMTPEGDGATLNMLGVKQRSDVILLNESSNAEAFKDQAEKVLQQYLK